MNVKKLWLMMMLSLCGMFCSGCGLLFIPDIKEFPAEPFQKVIVKDYDTKEPIENAKVEFSISKYENWLPPGAMCFPPVLYDMDSEVAKKNPAAFKVSTSEYHEEAEHFIGQHLGKGIYTLTPRTKCGWIQSFFPIPTPLGCTLYRTYSGSFGVSAPGYKCCVVINCERGFPTGPVSVCDQKHQEVQGTYFIAQKDHIEIFLPKAGTTLTPIPSKSDEPTESTQNSSEK